MKLRLNKPKTSPASTFHLMGGILIILLTITSCSDVPYSGPMYTINQVDQYLSSTGQDTVCFQDGFDSFCVKLLPGENTKTDNTPTVHVYPTNIVYVFSHEGNPILQAKRLMDTTQIMHELADAGRVNYRPDSSNTNTVIDDNAAWIIQIYYPRTFPEANRGRTHETSGFNIRVVDGTQIDTDKRDDLQIQYFTQINGIEGSRIAEFTVSTESSKITIQVNGLVTGNTATFHIDADDVASEQEKSILRLTPIN